MVELDFQRDKVFLNSLMFPMVQCHDYCRDKGPYEVSEFLRERRDSEVNGNYREFMSDLIGDCAECGVLGRTDRKVFKKISSYLPKQG